METTTKQRAEYLLKQVIREAQSLNIPVSPNIEDKLMINSRAKSRFGCCRQRKTANGSIFTIEISSMLLRCGEEKIKGTLAHEILHTCAGCQNHGGTWKLYAEKMNQAYGYRIKRTSTYEELGIEQSPKKKAVRYEITCQNCGAVFTRQKRSKLVTHTKQYRCKCGGKLVCRERKHEQ